MQLLKLKPAAEVLGVSYNWLRVNAMDGTIPAFKSGKGRGRWLVDPDLVKEAIREKMLTN